MAAEGHGARHVVRRPARREQIFLYAHVAFELDD
jgi:hypothetical protein